MRRGTIFGIAQHYLRLHLLLSVLPQYSQGSNRSYDLERGYAFTVRAVMCDPELHWAGVAIQIMGGIGMVPKAKWVPRCIASTYMASRISLFFSMALLVSAGTGIGRRHLCAHIACIGLGTLVHMAGKHLSVAHNRHVGRGRGEQDWLLDLTTRIHALCRSVYCR
jgi:hypothetical protein